MSDTSPIATEPLYLRPGMSEAEAFTEFNKRNPYYHDIAERFVGFARMLHPKARRFLDLLPRTGYNADAIERDVDVSSQIFLLEHRPSFITFLEGKLGHADYYQKLIKSANLNELVGALAGIRNIDVILACETIAPFAPRYRELVQAAGRAASERAVFGITMGPSYHKFRRYNIANFRNGGTVGEGETMSELSHPIHQAVHQELVLLAKERHGYDKNDAYPPAENAFNLADLEKMNAEAGFPLTIVIEERFRVPGWVLHHYCQNGWTFYMRFGALLKLREEKPAEAIALLKEAIENVRAMPQYPAWCEVTAYHPVGYCFALRG